MTEKEVEQYLVKRVKGVGGKALKFVSPGMAGAPDRLVMMPRGRMWFVELKAPGRKPRKLQEFVFNDFRALGFEVKVFDSKEQIDDFVREVQNGI